MAETTKKNVTNEALEEALKVVKNNLPGAATAEKAGLVKPGSGLNVDSEGALSVVLDGIEVDPSNVAAATKTSKGVMQVGDGLSVAAGVVSVDNANIDSRAQAKVDALKLKTINGQSIKGDGDIAIDLTLYKIVESLPTADIDDTKIYLVRNTENVPDGEQNVYTEYIHTADGWEKIGEYKTAIDLTPYAKAENVYTKEEMDAFMDNAAGWAQDNAKDITALQTATSDAEMKKKYPNLAADLTQKADKTYVDETFVKATELEALCMTAADGKALAEKVFA